MWVKAVLDVGQRHVLRIVSGVTNLVAGAHNPLCLNLCESDTKSNKMSVDCEVFRTWQGAPTNRDLDKA